MPHLCRLRPASSSMSWLQPWQFHAQVSDGQGGETVVADQPVREADQIDAKVVSHDRYATFQMAEVAVSRQMFAKIRRSSLGCGRSPYRRDREMDEYDQRRCARYALIKAEHRQRDRLSASDRLILMCTWCVIVVAK